MKKVYLQIILFAALAVMLSAFPTYLASPAPESVSVPDIKIDFKETVAVSTKQNKINIILGESESQRQEREKSEMLAKQKTNLVRTESVAMSYSTDLGSLRTLYQEAASQYGIDWRLIEAVHQVETGKSATCKASYAGAKGPMQFMPSTFRAYAQGGSNICDLKDSVFAAANLLAQSGASEGDIDSALFNYNHSSAYVKKVKNVMNSI